MASNHHNNASSQREYLMDKMDMPTFFAQLLKLSMSYGIEMKEERAEIYFEDLAEFPLEQVLTAMTWARQNLGRFPMIADLRIQIEGSDEDHANQAWDAVIKMLYTERSSSFTIMDLVLAKTIQQTWSNWPGACRFFVRLPDEMAQTAAKRAFRIAYTENYKHRSELSQTMTCPT